MIQKRETDVEQLFGPLMAFFTVLLVYWGLEGSDILTRVLLLLGAIGTAGLSALFFWMWYDIHFHPEKWRSAL